MRQLGVVSNPKNFSASKMSFQSDIVVAKAWGKAWDFNRRGRGGLSAMNKSDDGPFRGTTTLYTISCSCLIF